MREEGGTKNELVRREALRNYMYMAEGEWLRTIGSERSRRRQAGWNSGTFNV